MSHSHHHSHTAREISDKGLLWAVVLNLGLSVFEFVAGAVAGSSALMADALHNTNDAAALLVAYVARKISRKSASRSFTFGYRRAELIGAMIQLTALIVVGLFLVYEAVHRYFQPQPIQGMWIMIAAGSALAVDVATAWLLWAMAKGSMNAKAAFLHNLTDAGASFAVLLGGAAIYWLGWNWVDPTLTLAIAGYILYLSFGMLRRTSRVLMEGTPEDIDLDDLQREIEGTSGVAGLHHLHVWQLDEERRALEAHIVIESGRIEDMDTIKTKLKERLSKRFDIAHSTREFEKKGFAQTQDGHDTSLIPGR